MLEIIYVSHCIFNSYDIDILKKNNDVLLHRVCVVCVCNIWTDVKLLLWKGGSARLTDTAQRRHCQLVVIWSLINSTYLQMIFFDRYRTGLSREPLNVFFGFCMVSAICFFEPGDILCIYSMYSFHRHGRGLSREPWTLTWSLSPWRELVLQ